MPSHTAGLQGSYSWGPILKSPPFDPKTTKLGTVNYVGERSVSRVTASSWTQRCRTPALPNVSTRLTQSDQIRHKLGLGRRHVLRYNKAPHLMLTWYGIDQQCCKVTHYRWGITCDRSTTSRPFTSQQFCDPNTYLHTVWPNDCRRAICRLFAVANIINLLVDNCTLTRKCHPRSAARWMSWGRNGWKADSGDWVLGVRQRDPSLPDINIWRQYLCICVFVRSCIALISCSYRMWPLTIIVTDERVFITLQWNMDTHTPTMIYSINNSRYSRQKLPIQYSIGLSVFVAEEVLMERRSCKYDLVESLPVIQTVTQCTPTSLT